MASLFGIMDVAHRGLSVATMGLRTTGHNISNVNTPGFSRQRQVTAASFPIAQNGSLFGSGVDQLTIERITDPFIQRQLMRQGSSFGAADAQAEALARIEETLNEQDGPGLTAALGELYDAFSDLSAASTPGAPIEREAVRSAASAAVDTLHRLDGQLRQQQSDANAGIVALVPEVNRLVQQIHQLNEEIARTEINTPANDHRDQMELLVRDLSDLVDVNTFPDRAGRVTVTLTNGLPLVEGGFARQLVTVQDPAHPFDPSFAQIRYRDGANDIDVTSDIGAGRLGGLLRARDTLIPAAIRSLDTVSYNLAAEVNRIHNLGVGLDGSTGDFFLALPAVEDAARDIALDPAILASTDAIAAGLTSAPGDNQNALALAAMRDTPAALFLPGDPPGPASGPARTLLDHAAAIVTDVGQQARTLEGSRSQQQRILEGLESRRDEVSGVSVDEEMTRLIELQAAFQANARVVTVLDRLLNDVIELI